MKPEEMIEICLEIESHFPSKRDDLTRKSWIKSLYGIFGLEAKETVMAAIRLAMLESDFEPKPAAIQRGIDTLRKRKGLKLPEEVYAKLRERARQGWTEERVIKALHNSRLPEAIRALNAIGWKEICTCDLDKHTWHQRTFCKIYNTLTDEAKKEQQVLEISDPKIAKLIADIPMKRLQ